MRRSIGSRLFDLVNHAVLGVLVLLTVLPFIYILSGSFATGEELVQRKFFLIPHTVTFYSYEYIFSSATIPRSLAVSFARTIVGTLVNLTFTGFMAYALAHKDIVGRRTILFLVMVTVIFNGGMIPTYMAVKSVGLLNSFWSMVLPGAIVSFYLLLWKNFFQQIPQELEESAEIEGCDDMTTFFLIVLPLSTASVATFTIFYAVNHWNSFFDAILYISDAGLWPVQVFLRQIVIMSQGGIGDISQFAEASSIPPESGIKMATIVISTLPILVVYPFMQRHFIRGIMAGAIKG